jgi:hypothetical protein
MTEYKLNGIDIQTPSRMQWLPRRPIDFSGEGRTIYPGVYQARLQWRLMAVDDFDTVRDQWKSKSATGTSVVNLPDIDGSSFAFREFSGVHISEPSMGAYFQEHVQNVVLVLTNIVIE